MTPEPLPRLPQPGVTVDGEPASNEQLAMLGYEVRVDGEPTPLSPPVEWARGILHGPLLPQRNTLFALAARIQSQVLGYRVGRIRVVPKWVRLLAGRGRRRPLARLLAAVAADNPSRRPAPHPLPSLVTESRPPPTLGWPVGRIVARPELVRGPDAPARPVSPMGAGGRGWCAPPDTRS